MKAIVTGGTGFIGSHLVEQLVQRGYRVLSISKDQMHAAHLESLGVRNIIGDINDGILPEPLLKDADYIFHVAGVTRAKNAADYFSGNFLATRRLVQLSANTCKRLLRFIYVSSLTAVGPLSSAKPIKEETPYHPVSTYGESKKLAELEVLKLKGVIPYTILRPSAVYGPRDRDMLQYIALIRKHIQPLIGFGTKWLNLIHRDDLVNGIIRAAESPHGENEIFFLGGEQNYTTEQIGDTIARVVHKSRIKFHLPEAMVYWVAGISEIFGKISGKPVFFNRQKVAEAIQIYWTCSVDKSRNLLGFQERFSLEKGMQQTYEWYLRHGWL